MPQKRYTIVSEYAKNAEEAQQGIRHVRRTRVQHFEDAVEAARAFHPEVDGKTWPNVSQEHIDNYERKGAEYSRGMFMGNNRYAAIIDHTPHEPTVYRDEN